MLGHIKLDIRETILSSLKDSYTFEPYNVLEPWRFSRNIHSISTTSGNVIQFLNRRFYNKSAEEIEKDIRDVESKLEGCILGVKKEAVLYDDNIILDRVWMG